MNDAENINIAPDLLPDKIKNRSKHPALAYWGKILGFLLITILVIGLGLSIKFLSSLNIQTGQGTNTKVSLLSQLTHLFTKADETLGGEENDRINILLLGIGGAGHEGALLTDTIILVSFKPSTDQVALLSIPRDLAVDFPAPYYSRKINNGLFFGQEMEYPGGGEALMAKTVGEVTGLDIQYYGRVDFSGFEQAIDGLGGVRINVEKSFSDSTYPTDDYGYQTVSFKAGEQLMDGTTALEYVRSRHGNNGEGSDFARAKRQQKVLLALKDKITSFSTLINPSKISEIINTLGSHTKTNMEVWEMLRLYTLAGNIDQNNIINYVLDNSENGLLENITGENGAYLLVPKTGDFSEVQGYVKNIFNQNEVEKEKAKIVIKNGTNTPGLAAAESKELAALNYNVIKVENYGQKDLKKTIIYDNANGQFPYTIKALKEKLQAEVVTNLPVIFEETAPYEEININAIDQLENINKNLNSDNDFDIMIILGANALPNQALSYR
ncbi:MAG: LCP family protein [Patescibacteria group bacterium]